MSFSIRNVKEHDFDLLNITDEQSGTVVSLLPGFGATLHGFSVRQREGFLFNVIDGYLDARELKNEMDRSYKGPKLSPFPCRIPGGKYRFNEHDYQLKHLFKDGTAIHGLLFDKPFTVLEYSADGGIGKIG